MFESGENYLETILILEKKIKSVRAIDIAKELDYSKPSISRAVKLLKKDGYIEVNNKGFIKLTENGKQKAESIYEKHLFLTDFFIRIANVSQETAEKDACRIEHVISNETFKGLKHFYKKIK